MEIGSLLPLNRLGNDFGRGDDPSQRPTGPQGLGKRVPRNDAADPIPDVPAKISIGWSRWSSRGCALRAFSSVVARVGCGEAVRMNRFGRNRPRAREPRGRLRRHAGRPARPSSPEIQPAKTTPSLHLGCMACLHRPASGRGRSCVPRRPLVPFRGLFAHGPGLIDLLSSMQDEQLDRGRYSRRGA